VTDWTLEAAERDFLGDGLRAWWCEKHAERLLAHARKLERDLAEARSQMAALCGFVNQVAEHGCRRVETTAGAPDAQDKLAELANAACGLLADTAAAAAAHDASVREKAMRKQLYVDQQYLVEQRAKAYREGQERMRERAIAIVPGGSVCDPQEVADAIRALAAEPKEEE
jgi:hypothetical protein